MSLLLTQGNALQIPLADESVHCSVCSPPYWKLRDYGIPGQLGMEPSLEEYVENMVAVFREVRRVLREDGHLFLNISDTRTKIREWAGIPHKVLFALQEDGWRYEDEVVWFKKNPMPESVDNRFTRAHEFVFMLNKSRKAFFDADAVREQQVQASVDRSKYDRKADKTNKGRPTGKDRDDGGMDYASGFNALPYTLHPLGRNRRTVWEIATAPYSGAHFATYPPALVEPCIKAGTSERGVCPECGSPWERVVEKGERIQAHWQNTEQVKAKEAKGKHGVTSVIETGSYQTYTTLGWQPTCDCKRVCPSCAGGSVEWTVTSPCCNNEGYVSHDPIPATVFDPFCGSATTLQVARALGRHGVGLDLSLEYLHLARQRLSLDALDDWTEGIGHSDNGKDGQHKNKQVPRQIHSIHAERKEKTVTDLPLFRDWRGNDREQNGIFDE